MLNIINYGIVGERGAWEIDHFIQYSRRGANNISNLVPACVSYNSFKSDLMPWEFDLYRFIYGEINPNVFFY